MQQPTRIVGKHFVLQLVAQTRLRFALLLLLGCIVLLASLAVVLPTSPAARAASFRASAVIPAYWSNESGPWSQLVQTHPAGTIAVANFNAGPPASFDSTFNQEVSQAHAAGIRVIGYVHTGFGGRALSAIHNDINGWSRYQVDGIFLDEVRANTANVAFYQQIANDIRGRTGAGHLVVSNAGWIPATSQYLQSADIIIAYEGTASGLSNFRAQVPAWMSDPARFAAIVEGVSSSQISQILQQNMQSHVGYNYLIDSTQVYSRLPSFWSQETADMASMA